ncbi:hypothetical protein OH76DRAFT_19227 [Lentinus brumalis]|uniref:Uncharacterized protein n=1 Tax=Lentinus brumalis TaxID=2498619 RepID=A0A371DX76_9APHY|nr:hypothetical protein OH76DRAFT_19227 [Polyporus brumalis]
MRRKWEREGTRARRSTRPRTRIQTPNRVGARGRAMPNIAPSALHDPLPPRKLWNRCVGSLRNRPGNATVHSPNMARPGKRAFPSSHHDAATIAVDTTRLQLRLARSSCQHTGSFTYSGTPHEWRYTTALPGRPTGCQLMRYRPARRAPEIHPP